MTYSETLHFLLFKDMCHILIGQGLKEMLIYMDFFQFTRISVATNTIILRSTEEAVRGGYYDPGLQLTTEHIQALK